MTSRRIYARAPIAEAVIDIRVSFPEAFDVQSLLSICDLEGDSYPTRRDLMAMEGEVTFGAQSGASARQHRTGYVCTSANSSQVFCVSAEGFAFSRLPPYERWEPFSEEARRLWDVFIKNSEPLSVTRIGVRFINRIALTQPIGDLREYLKTFPEVSAEMSNQALSEYFMQLKIPQDDTGAMAVINQVLHGAEKSEHVEVLLDIDLFQELELKPEGGLVWKVLEEMHVRKNDIFEACITDKVREAIS